MNKKNFLIVGIVLFVLLTLIAMSMDVSQRKKVSFTNQNLALNNENPNIENKTTNVNSTNSKFSNNCLAALLSNDPVGSSAKINFGFVIIALADAILCF